MRNRVVFYIVSAAICILALSSCFDRDKYAPKPYVRALEIVKLSDSTFMHISYLKDGNGGYTPCNGYVYLDNKEALIFNTPLNDTLSDQLVTFVEQELKATVKGVIVNHNYENVVDGLWAFYKKNIPSYAYIETANILAKDSIFITHPFEEKQQIVVGNTTVESRYFGKALTSDNVVSYIPEVKTLVGGSMIKPLGALKGNIKDAHLENWSQTVVKIKETYPDVATVVPGEGGIGGPELLDYTISLFEEYKKAAVDLNLE